MNKIEPLPDALSADTRRVNVVLFSQPGCEFCAEERANYLKPLAALGRPDLTIAEVALEARQTMRDWRGRVVTQGEFAEASGARFAPTVMFFNASGRPVAEPIVGLSRDFFGIYLEQRIATALRALS
ncbi:MAG: thioredoxin [Pseudomonadota bacterium]|nr:thioredoxin [Pseudomonadota bacterium]